MPKFGTKSTERLNTVHPDLQEILNECIKYVDFSIVEGHRGQVAQDHYYNTGKSKVKYPDGKHNKTPAQAVDIVPYHNNTWDWKDLERFKNIIYFIKGVAFAKGIELRLGIDWDNDFENRDHTFHDYPHIELRNKLIKGRWVKYPN
jgi:peptidoglycan LD-endopeptidase CwlK